MARIAIVLSFLVLCTQGDAGRIAHKSLAEQKGKGNSMIAKVIEMLGEENEKIKADLALEGKAMAEYMEWCDDTQAEHFYAIKSAKEKIADLTATITDASAELDSLNAEIESLGNEIAERNTEIDEANADRKKSKEEFEKAEAEQTAMVEEMEQMELALKQQMNAMTTPPPVGTGEEAEAGAALVQSKASPAATFEALLQISQHGQKMTSFGQNKLSNLDKKSLEKLQKAMTMMVNSVWVDPDSKKNLATLNQGSALVQEGEDPAAAAPAGADGGASENLAAFEGLKGKAEESLQKMRDEEVKTQNEHDLNIASLDQAVALASDKLDDAKKDHARVSKDKAEAENELGETEASKAADEKALESVTTECTETSAGWETRQKEAKAEMAAIDKAKEILASRVTVFLQVQQPQAGGDVLKNQAKISKTRQKLVNHFRTLGQKIHSIAMLNLVSVAAQDPMENVKNLLKELVEKLTKEAAEAESLHQFCQEEKKKTSAQMKKKNMALEKLNSRIDTASTKKDELEENIATLSEEIAEIDKTTAEATKLRNEENANFLKVESDFSEAADAVDDAIDALKEYYGDAFLVQTDAKSKLRSKDDAPPTFGGAKKDSAGGIIGILETMGEEFRKTVKDARADEREAVKAFETLIQESKVSKAAKEAEMKGAESQIKSLTVSLHDNGEDKKMAEKEKAAIEEYIEKLKPQCEGRVVPYAERKAKREAEINGLKEALTILEEESPAGAFSFLQRTTIRAHN